MRLVELGDEINFGKYQGDEITYEEVMQLDPDYFKWMLENAVITLSDTEDAIASDSIVGFKRKSRFIIGKD